jgi:hypothetical protein
MGDLPVEDREARQGEDLMESAVEDENAGAINR